ncbi:MAG: hypothetical protein ACREVO_18770 [Steroidobacteraceae bacterium]
MPWTSLRRARVCTPSPLPFQAPPTFANTIVAMEKSGRLLARVAAAFNCLTQANTDDTLEKVQAQEAPRLAAH